MKHIRDSREKKISSVMLISRSFKVHRINLLLYFVTILTCYCYKKIINKFKIISTKHNNRYY